MLRRVRLLLLEYGDAAYKNEKGKNTPAGAILGRKPGASYTAEVAIKRP